MTLTCVHVVTYKLLNFSFYFHWISKVYAYGMSLVTQGVMQRRPKIELSNVIPLFYVGYKKVGKKFLSNKILKSVFFGNNFQFFFRILAKVVQFFMNMLKK